MINWKRNLFFVWLSQLLTLAAFNMIVPFIPLFMRDVLKMEDIQTRGAWVAAFYFAGQVGFCISTPVWGTLSDRYGRKIMLLRASLISGLLMPLMIFAPSAVFLVGLRFIIGCFSGVSNAAQTLICSSTPEDRHGMAFGALSSAFWSGNMLGYVLGGVVISKFGFTWSFITSGLLCLTAVTMILLFVREDFVYRPKKYGKASRDRLKRLSPRKIPFPKFSYLVWSILMLFMLLGIVRIFDNPYVAMQVEVINGAADIAKWTAIISALAAIAGIGSGLLMGHLSDRFPANKIILPAFIGSAAMMALQGAAVNLPMLGGARFFKYFFASGMDPIFQSMLSRAVPKNKRGAAFGFSASCRTVGALLGSALSGVVVYQLGVRSVFYVGGILFLILLPLVLLVIKLSKKFKVS